MTNCCDDYGNCRQGRDYPVRQERIERVRKLGKENRDQFKLLSNLGPLFVAALIVLASFLSMIYSGASGVVT